MLITSFQVKDKLKKACFFQETFLITNSSIKMILKIFFLIFSNINIRFAGKKFI